jgi:hypothetical protein
MKKEKKMETIQIPITDLVESYRAQEESEEFQLKNDMLKKYELLQLQNILETRFDDFFSVLLSLAQNGAGIKEAKSLGDIADYDDAYDAVRKARLKIKYLKSFIAFPKLSEAKKSSNYVLIQLSGDSYRVLLQDAEGLTGNETKVYLPEEYKKYDELQFNQSHYEAILDKEIINLLIQLFEIVLLPVKKEEKKEAQQQRDMREMFKGKEQIIWKYYKALKGE